MREAQLHTAEQKQKKRRMAAALARGETALESGPISSVCHWQTSWLVPLLHSNPAISKQKHPRTLSPLSPDPSLLEFFPPSSLAFSRTIHSVHPILVGLCQPIGGKQRNSRPLVHTHTIHTQTEEWERERVMRKQNECNREGRWVERIRARGRGRAWSPWRRSNRKRTREHKLTEKWTQCYHITVVGCIKTVTHQKWKRTKNSSGKKGQVCISKVPINHRKHRLKNSAAWTDKIVYTHSISSASSTLTTALTFFLSSHSTRIVSLQLATINMLSKHTLFFLLPVVWVREKNSWKMLKLNWTQSRRRQWKTHWQPDLTLQHANQNINFYKMYSLGQYSSPKKRKKKVLLSGAPPTAHCTAEHTNVWVIHQTKASNARVTVPQKTILT